MFYFCFLLFIFSFGFLFCLEVKNERVSRVCIWSFKYYPIRCCCGLSGSPKVHFWKLNSWHSNVGRLGLSAAIRLLRRILLSQTWTHYLSSELLYSTATLPILSSAGTCLSFCFSAIYEAAWSFCQVWSPNLGQEKDFRFIYSNKSGSSPDAGLPCLCPVE